MSPEEISPIELGVLLSTLHPNDTLAVAARLGLEVGALRAGVDEPQFGTQCELDYDCTVHRHHHFAIPSLMERRWPPTGDREMWIKYGPAGPPADTEAVSA